MDPQLCCKRVHDPRLRCRFARAGCIESGSTSNHRVRRKMASNGETVSQSLCRKTVRVGRHRWLHRVARPVALLPAVNARGAQPQGQVLTALTPVDKRGAQSQDGVQNESAVDARGAQPQGQVLTALTPVDKRRAWSQDGVRTSRQSITTLCRKASVSIESTGSFLEPTTG
jgi:hypothetical protein